MTKREILERMNAVACQAPDDGPEGRLDWVLFHRLMKDLVADVRAEEEAPRQAEGAAPGPVRGFRDALVRVKAILGGLPMTATNGPTREAMLRLCDDLNDAGNDRQSADVGSGPGQPGPVPEVMPPAPRTVIIILPPGVRALIEAETE